MKLRIYSDIHLDHYSGYDAKNGRPILWYPPPLPDDKETTLILAGDLWTGTRFIEFGGFSWIGYVAQQFKQVLIVLGNHDYWPRNHQLCIKGGGDKCNGMLQDCGLFNVKVLDMGTHEDGDFLFIGATLWTDIDKNDALAMYNMTRFMNYDGKCAYETGPGGQWSRFHSDKWVHTHDRHKAYIKRVAEQNRDKKIVVITHHVPLLGIGDPMYFGQASNAYYMSDLSDLILDNDNILMWCHGHTHYQHQTRFPAWADENNGCLIINNCVGYKDEHMEQQGLIRHEVIEL